MVSEDGVTWFLHLSFSLKRPSSLQNRQPVIGVDVGKRKLFTFSQPVKVHKELIRSIEGVFSTTLLQQVTKKLVTQFEMIIVEDSAPSIDWFPKFIYQLRYKAKEWDNHIVCARNRYASSRICSNCRKMSFIYSRSSLHMPKLSYKYGS